jgi:hypothetical protein
MPKPSYWALGRDFVIEYALAQSAAQISETAVQLARSKPDATAANIAAMMVSDSLASEMTMKSLSSRTHRCSTRRECVRAVLAQN